MSLALKMKVDKGIIGRGTIPIHLDPCPYCLPGTSAEKEGFVEYYQKRFDGRDDESFMEEVDLLLEVPIH